MLEAAIDDLTRALESALAETEASSKPVHSQRSGRASIP
jgi:hypothetical protein